VLRREEIKMELSFGLHLMTPTEAKELVDGAVADGTLVHDGEGYRIADADAPAPSGEAVEVAAEAGAGAAGEAGVEEVDAPPKGAPEAGEQAVPPASSDGEATSATTTAPPELFRELVALAAAAAGVSEREIVRRVNRGQRAHLGVQPEVEALYVARQCGAGIAPFVGRVERRVVDRRGG